MNVSKYVTDRVAAPYRLRAGSLSERFILVLPLLFFAGLVAASCGDSRMSTGEYAVWCESAGTRIAETLYRIDGWDAFASAVDEMATEGKRLSPPEHYAEQHEVYVLSLRELANPPFFIEWAVEAMFGLLTLTADLHSFITGRGREEIISEFERTGISRDVVADVFSFNCGGS